MLVPARGDKGWGRGLCQFCSRRLSALARRCVSASDRIVNCAPAKGCVWPDIDRHGRGCAHIGRRGAAVLLRRFAFVSWVSYVSYWSVLRLITPAIRFYWNVLRLVHACYTFLLECLAFDHACLFSFVRKRETACERLHFYSARVGIAIRAFSNGVRLSSIVGSLWVCALLWGDPDGKRPESLIRKEAPRWVGASLAMVC